MRVPNFSTKHLSQHALYRLSNLVLQIKAIRVESNLLGRNILIAQQRGELIAELTKLLKMLDLLFEIFDPP